MSKKLFFAAFAAAGFALVGCNEKDVELPVEEHGLVDLMVNVSDPATKFTNGSDGAEINDIQTFVFNADGVLEAYAHDTGTQSGKVTCTKGTKTVAVLVNAKPHGDVASYTELCARKSDLFDNSSSGCVMEGSTTAEITATTTLDISVKRHAARLILDNVSLDIELDHYKDAEFKFTSIYLVNVAGDRAFFTENDPAVWYNQLKMDSNLVTKDIVYEACSESLTDGGKLSKEYRFYAYQNPYTTDSQDATWSPRPTRLVVEGTFDGKNYYYPVTLKGLKANCSYNVSLTIRRPGSTSPDTPVDKYTVTSKITIVDWETGSSYSEVI